MSTEKSVDIEKCIRRFDTIIRREFPETLIDIDWEADSITVSHGSCSAVVTFTEDGKPQWGDFRDSDFQGKNDEWTFGFDALLAIERSVNRLYNDTDIHADETTDILTALAECESQRLKDAEITKDIEEYMIRYGGILTRYFPEHLTYGGWAPKKLCITYSPKARKMLLYYESKTAIITFNHEGGTTWSEFDDGDFDSKSYGRRSSMEFFEPIQDEVEKHYYSEESFDEDAKRFTEAYEAGEYGYSTTEYLQGCVTALLQIGIVSAISAIVIWLING